MKNLWILTEERPKLAVLQLIVKKFCSNSSLSFEEVENAKIVPLMQGGLFQFTYELTGGHCSEIGRILIKVVSGDSSFVDYLVFHQEDEPTRDSTPLYAIEETKTDDSESRNTGVYQRCSKFVYLEFFYPGVKKIMFYNLRSSKVMPPTPTNILGTRMLLTIGVEIWGKEHLDMPLTPFTSYAELIELKGAMRMPPAGNTPILIVQNDDHITISGKLLKADSLSHDPNIGALSIIAACLRQLGWEKRIVIVQHGLSQKNVSPTNKFIRIADKLNIELEGLERPAVNPLNDYWHYEFSREKLASIFLHICVETYTSGRVIYENHAGGERGYFLGVAEEFTAIPKYQEGLRESYKEGNKDAIIFIPDVVILDERRSEVINVEGKKYSTRKQGIEELGNYDYIEDNFIRPIYKPNTIIRTVCVYGSTLTSIEEPEISFMLNEEGAVIVNHNAPEIIKEAISGCLAAAQ